MPVLKRKKEDGTWEVVGGGSNVEIDPSLEIEGMAADAKAVGDAINTLSIDIAEAGAIDIDLDNSNSGEVNTINADTLGGKHESELSVANAINADSLGGILAEEYVKLSDLENLDTSGISMELLWENAGVTGTFIGQTINVDIEDGDLVIITSRVLPSNSHVEVGSIIYAGNSVRAIGIMSYKLMYRDIEIQVGKVIFSDCSIINTYGSIAEVSNTHLIPHRIFRLRGK